MKIEEIRALDDDALLKLSLERCEPYNNYTADAIKAQKEWNNRRGNTIQSHNSMSLGKLDRSYYSNRYY